MIKDRVFETSTSSGIGNFTLDGAVDRFLPFSKFGTEKFYYAIECIDKLGDISWEIGDGVLVGGLLERSRVILSSNANNLVNFPAGQTWAVFNPLPAEYIKTSGRPPNISDISSISDMLTLIDVNSGDIAHVLGDGFYINVAGVNTNISDWKRLSSEKQFYIVDTAIMVALGNYTIGDIVLVTEDNIIYKRNTSIYTGTIVTDAVTPINLNNANAKLSFEWDAIVGTVPLGGNTDDILMKSSSAVGDVNWKNIVDAGGW